MEGDKVMKTKKLFTSVETGKAIADVKWNTKLQNSTLLSTVHSLSKNKICC